VLEDTNSPSNYLVARALDRAARQGARSTALDPDLIGTDVEHIVDASPLDLAYGERPDLAVTRRELVGASDGVRRLVLGSSDRDPSWLSELLVALLVNDESAFWTRSVLELSPDGESLVIPMLGRSAQQGVGPYREFGIDQIGTLEDSRVTRWVNGRALSLDRLVALAGEVIGHDLSIGVIDGYIYVQSRWKATEHPKELLSTRQIGL
jgi:hypothetical protein